MKDYQCSCWVHYPNESHKKKNGTWKCVDRYECVRDLVDGKNWDAATHCKRKEEVWQRINTQ